MQGSGQNVAAEWEKLRPVLAHTFPFEPDTFQKEAIVLLEQVSAVCELQLPTRRLQPALPGFHAQC